MSLLSEILDSMSDARMRHAALVHVPLAASVLGLPLVAAFAFTLGRSRALRWCSAGLYAIAVVATLLATSSGASAKLQLGTATLEARELVAEHEWLASKAWIFAFLTALGATGTALGSRARLARLSLAVCIAGSLTTAGWMALVGHHGGMAVYAHGVGLPAQVAESKQREADAGTVLQGDPRRARFEVHVRPLLERSCIGCHGPGELAASRLDLTSIGAILRGGDRGPAVVPGDPEASLLYRAVAWTHESLRMPLHQDRLPEQQLEHVRSWIDEGAIWSDPPSPATTTPENAAPRE